MYGSVKLKGQYNGDWEVATDLETGICYTPEATAKYTIVGM